MQIDLKLIEKYNKPVPRYTSYPPANYFRDDIPTEKLIEQIQGSNTAGPQNISLYFHIPFCQKRCFYCGCNAYAMRKVTDIDLYVDTIIQEIHLTVKHLDPSRKVSQVHFGGGTPNSLSIEQVKRIMDAITENFTYLESPEIAMECNPAYLDEDYVTGLAMMGFNRFSLGIQDFDTKILKTVNRDPSKLPMEELIKLIRSEVSNVAINLDFIYGLPYQTPVSFFKTIEKALKLSPDRLVTFSYAHMPSIFKAQKVFDKIGLPQANEKLKMFLSGYEILTQGGYRAIGFDHYALESDELSLAQQSKTLHRNFQGYCTRKTTGQVYAFGVSGISQLEYMYAQTTKSVDKYIEGINSETFIIEKAYILNTQERIIREVINELMCNLEVKFDQIAARLNVTVDDVSNAISLDKKQLKEFQNDLILKFDESKIELLEAGLPFTRNVAASFDPLMQNSSKNFSKTV